MELCMHSSAYITDMVPVCWVGSLLRMHSSDIIPRQPMKMAKDQHQEEDTGAGQGQELLKES